VAIRLDADIVVIGSGAAGGVLAATLRAQTGARVILVERGGHYTRRFFNQREWDMDVLYADRGGRSTADGAMPVRGGECVGGGTTVNYALCFDPVEAVWNRWRRDAGLTGYSFDPAASDYGIAGLNIAACLAEVRQRINVHPVADADVNDNNRLFAQGCAARGITTRRFEVSMRDCLGCGFCAEGCAYDRKQGTLVTYVPDAVAAGVRLVHHCDVESLVFTRAPGGDLRAAGLRGRVRPTESGAEPNSVSAGAIEVRAPLVVLAAGAIGSPALLQRSGHPDPHGVIGRGLVLHPSLPIVGVMPAPIVNYRGITGAAYSDHFVASHGFYFECLFGHPVYGSTVIPSLGRAHFDLMRRYARLAGFGVMIVDEADSRNRVEWHAPTGEARIHYRLSDDAKRRLRFAAARGVEIFFAAGAEEALLASDEPIGPLASPRFARVQDAAHCESLRFEPHQTVVTSAHCQGTVKMGEDPARAVVDSRGESHHVRNLLVCDASVFPESCGVNPMLSIMTMARYQARRIAGELGRYGL
jgi:choline dehydrogenase-like flavoprotein